MSKEWEKDPEFSDLTPEAILEYREFMEQMFDVIRRNKSQFLRDPSFSTGFKIERIEELLDFFVVDGDFERCSELSSLKELLEMKLIINNA
jgi:hypothetical protein|tara:strand:+ start:460 stop:732 length:273 start_codon:yes stop_codon:yes gene_type:complete